MSQSRYVIDREAVAAEVARTRAILEQGYGHWFARQTALNLGIFYVIVMVLRWNQLPEISSWPVSKLAASFLMPLVGALALTWWTGRRNFNDDMLDVDRRIMRINEDLRSLGGPGWVRRSLMTGLVLGVAIGIPVGAAMMLAWRPEDLPGMSRALTIPVFVVMTLLWSVPMAFLLRWMTLLALKRLVKEVRSDGPE